MTFNVRERPGRSLKPAKRQLQNRNLELELQGREITENDYETLLNLGTFTINPVTFNRLIMIF